MEGQRKLILGAAAVILVVAIGVAGVFVLRDQPATEGPALRIDTLRAMPAEPADADSVGTIVDEPAPAFRLPTLEGDTLALADLKGQVVVVNFWATWCAPCRVEIPDLIEMQEALEDDGVRFVGVSLDHDAVDAVKAFAEDAGFNYPIVLDDGDVADDFGGIYALPTTILIDRDGKVVRRIPGLVTMNLLMPLLQEMANVNA